MLGQSLGRYAFNHFSGNRLLRGDGYDADILRGVYSGQQILFFCSEGSERSADPARAGTLLRGPGNRMERFDSDRTENDDESEEQTITLAETEFNNRIGEAVEAAVARFLAAQNQAHATA
jgi:hypothetical protein